MNECDEHALKKEKDKQQLLPSQRSFSIDGCNCGCGDICTLSPMISIKRVLLWTLCVCVCVCVLLEAR